MTPDGWRPAKLDDVATSVTSGPRGWAEYYADSGPLFLRITNLCRNSIVLDLSDLKHVRLPKACSEGQRTQVRPGDVLISITADLGMVGVIPPHWTEEAYINQHIALVRPNPQEVVSSFLAYALSAPSTQSQFRKLNDPGAKAGLNLPSTRTLCVLLPPISEQRRIAAILGSVDETIQATQAVIDQARQVKKGLLQQLLTRGIGHTRFMKTVVGEIPVGWTVIQLGQIFTQRKEAGRLGLPVISVTMNAGLVEREKLERRVVSGLPPEKHSLARPGDLVYNMMRMWQGVSGVASCECLVSPAYVVCRPSENILPAFAAQFFKASDVVRKLHQYSQGITGDRLRLYFENFAAIPVALPPKDEQSRIACILDNLDEEIASHEDQIGVASQLRIGIMDALLTGRIRVRGVA